MNKIVLCLLSVSQTFHSFILKAAESVTFDILILEKKVYIIQEYSKNTQIQVKVLPFS